MLTFFSFIITLIGCFNWFFIASFQYDIVAGFFGTQSSLFSRLVYFIIGMAAFVLLVMAIKNKGVIKITENSFKKKIQQQPVETQSQNEKPNFSYIEPTEPEPISNYNNEIPAQKFPREGYKDFDSSQYDN